MKKLSAILYRFMAILLFLPICGQFAFGQQNISTSEYKRPLTRILFIFDASYSMIGKWQSDQKIVIAKRMLHEMLDSLKGIPDLEIALRVYGHQSKVPPQDCNDTRLEVPFGKDNIARIQNRLSFIQPKGTTPIAKTLEKSAGDFPNCPSCRNIIILITDGIEECKGDPCAISKALQEKGIVLKPFVIGIGMENYESLKCVGHLFDANTEESFKTTLGYIISQVLNNSTAQVNLLDNKGLPTETDNTMTFLDHVSGTIKYSFVHTMNHKGPPDTLELDPLPVYDLIVHTIPPLRKDSIFLVSGKHTVIPLDAPQGYLNLRVKNRNDFGNLPCRIMKSGSEATLHVQYMQTTEKYIVGKYDIEVFTLPRIRINNVDIGQSTTTNIEVDQPGIVTISSKVKGYGSILTKTQNGYEFVCALNPELITHSYLLQPGEYQFVFRHRGSKRTTDTVQKVFSVESGRSVFVNAY